MVLSPADAKVALRGLVAVNRAQMRRAGPQRPRLMDLIRQGKIRYTRYDPAEHWQFFDNIMGAIARLGYAYVDCEDLALWLAAEQQEGDGAYPDPSAQPDVYRTGTNVSHVVTSSSRHGRLDPSRWAGMGWSEPTEEEVSRYRALLGLPGSPDDAYRGAPTIDVLAVLMAAA